MFKKVFGLMLLTLIIFSTQCLAATPPNKFKVKDIPDDGSTLKQDFKVIGKTPCYKTPEMSGDVDYLQPNEIVRRMFCIVHSNPSAHKVRVLRKTQACSTRDGKADITLNKGDLVYLIMATGGGNYLAWHKGKQIWQLNSSVNKLASNRIIKGAWGEYLGKTTDFNLGVERWDCFMKADDTFVWVLIHDSGMEIYHLEPLEEKSS